MAVGGTFGGNPTDATVFPQYMYVDYVRVYQKPEHIDPDANMGDIDSDAVIGDWGSDSDKGVHAPEKID